MLKTNVGHSETASALTSIAKVLITFENHCIPASLHFNNINEKIDALVSGLIKPVTQNTEFCDSIVGINSFGFGGANVHILLKPNYKEVGKNSKIVGNTTRLIPLFGRTVESVKYLMEFIRQNPNKITEDFLQMIYNIKDTNGFDYRTFVIKNNEYSETEHSIERISDKLPLWFVFPGITTH